MAARIIDSVDVEPALLRMVLGSHAVIVGRPARQCQDRSTRQMQGRPEDRGSTREVKILCEPADNRRFPAARGLMLRLILWVRLG